MSRVLIIGAVAVAGILSLGTWASSKIEPQPNREVAFAEEQVANLEKSARENGIKLGKSHAQLVADEIAQDRIFRQRMSDMKRMGDELETAEAQQLQAHHERQCAAGLKSAC